MLQLNGPLTKRKLVALGLLIHGPILIFLIPGTSDSVLPTLGDVLFVLIFLASWMICLVHAARNEELARARKQARWIIFIVLLTPLASILYFWLHIRPHQAQVSNARP